MNAANAPKNTGSGGPMKLVLGVVFLILALVGLYYLYQYLYGKNPSRGSVQILSGNPLMTTSTAVADSGGLTAVQTTDLKGVLDGGEYSVSFWVYVADTKGFGTGVATKLAHLMEISDRRFGATKGKTLLFVGLNPINGTLVVRQNTSASDTDTYAMIIDNALTSADLGTNTSDNLEFPLSTLISNYNSENRYREKDRCDIINGIEYQRWILVTVVGNSRTLDVYIDGKLARSCVYNAPFALGAPNGEAKVYFGLDNGGKLKGYFSSGNFYNYALTPDAVWGLYQQGPGGSSSFLDYIKNLFNVNVSFSTTEGTK
jgi:hypothetical protein